MKIIKQSNRIKNGVDIGKGMLAEVVLDFRMVMWSKEASLRAQHLNWDLNDGKGSLKIDWEKNVPDPREKMEWRVCWALSCNWGSPTFLMFYIETN